MSVALSKILRALSLTVVVTLACSAPLAAQTPTLAWNANPESNVAGYTVQFGTQPGNPSVTLDVGNVTSRQITGLLAGATYYFRVLAYNTAGQSSSPSTEISYVVPGGVPGPSLSLTSISPTSGTAGGGTVITLQGSNFANGATVRVGGAAATGVTFVSSTQLRATTPPGAAGAQSVQVTNPNGQSSTLAGAFTYTASSPTDPTITSVSPSSGPAAGGTTITITGSNFVLGAGGEIRVGGVLATGITYISSTQLRATTPAGAGPQAVSVRNPNGATATLAGGFTYTAPAPAPTPAPTLSSVSPSSGSTAGGTVITLNGGSFVSGATVRVGGVAATGVTFVSASQLRATTPAGTSGAKPVQVTNPDGQSATLSNGFTYSGSTSPGTPVLTSVSPSSGSFRGGTAITITGANFVFGAGGEIRIGGRMAGDIEFVSSTQLRATTRGGAVGPQDVTVRNPTGETATLANGFTYTNGSSEANSTAEGARVAPVDAEAGTADAAAAASPVGAIGDPALDGATSPDGAPAPGVFRRYLAEGIVSDQMTTRLSIANPQSAEAHVTLSFSDSNGRTTRFPLTVPARSRRTVDLSTIPELAGTSFSTVLESDQAVGLDRLISWDRRGVAASLASAIEAPSTRWYFAEGSTMDPFELFYLVQNPGTTPADVQIRYLLPDGLPPIIKTYSVAPGSRTTIWVDREEGALATTDVAAEITSTNGTPIVVERSLYVSEAGTAVPRGGDTSAGIVAPSTSWFLEGATGDYAMFLLLANPGAEAATVRATYAKEDGSRVVKSYTVAPNSRTTVNVAREDASLAKAAMAITLESSAAIVAERTKWWGADGAWDDALSGGGTTEAASRWLLAEGEQGGARQASTSLVIFNQGASAADVVVTLLFEDGPEASATFTVGAGAQHAVPLEQAFPAAEGRRFSLLVEGADPSARLVVDSAVYWRAEGLARTAGADGAAVRLP